MRYYLGGFFVYVSKWLQTLIAVANGPEMRYT